LKKAALPIFPRVHLREFVSVSEHHVPSIFLQLPASRFIDSLHSIRLCPARKSLHIAFDLTYSGLTFPNPNHIDSLPGNACASFH
jgi:hypothetical protein